MFKSILGVPQWSFYYFSLSLQVLLFLSSITPLFFQNRLYKFVVTISTPLTLPDIFSLY